MFNTLLAGAAEASTSQGDSGIGPVVIVVGITIGAALVLTWIINRLPNWGEGSRWDPLNWRRRPSSSRGIPDDPRDQPPRGPFDP